MIENSLIELLYANERAFEFSESLDDYILNHDLWHVFKLPGDSFGVGCRHQNN